MRFHYFHRPAVLLSASWIFSSAGASPLAADEVVPYFSRGFAVNFVIHEDGTASADTIGEDNLGVCSWARSMKPWSEMALLR